MKEPEQLGTPLENDTSAVTGEDRFYSQPRAALERRADKVVEKEPK